MQVPARHLHVVFCLSHFYVLFDAVLLLVGHQSWYRTWRFVYNFVVNSFQKLHFFYFQIISTDSSLYVDPRYEGYE